VNEGGKTALESTLPNPALAAARITPKTKTIAYWTVAAIFCLGMSFTAYYELLPQGARAFARLGFLSGDFRMELSLAKLAGVAALLIPLVPAQLKEWANAGFAINVVSAILANLSIRDIRQAFIASTITSVLWALSYYLWRRLRPERPAPRRAPSGNKSKDREQSVVRHPRVIKCAQGQTMTAYDLSPSATATPTFWGQVEELEFAMKRLIGTESASDFIDAKINELGDWRGKMLAKVRAIIHSADLEIVEEVKWMGTPVFSHNGIVCTAETYKNAVKMTFAKGAELPDPSGLFNSSLDGNVRRAIDIHEGDTINAAALKDLIRAAVALNLRAKAKARASSSKRA